MIWIGRPYGRLFNVAFLLAMLFAVCSMIGGVQQAQAQGPLGTLRDALRTNRELVQANRADAVAAREANVQLLRSSGGARLTLGTCRTEALVVPHVRQQLVQPLIVPPPQPLILQQQFNGYVPQQPAPLIAPQALHVPQALIVPSYQLPQALVAQPLAYQPPPQLLVQPQRIVVAGCHL